MIDPQPSHGLWIDATGMVMSDSFHFASIFPLAMRGQRKDHGGGPPCHKGPECHGAVGNGVWIYVSGARIMRSMKYCMDRLLKVMGAGMLAGGLVGCGPNFEASANRLRAQTITQEREISDLKEKVTARDADVRGLQQQIDNTTPRVQTLPDQRLGELFTVGRLEIQRSTAVTDLGDGKTGLRVYLRTMTDDGMVLPATGQLTIEAFALAAAPAAPVRLGTWNFSPGEMKKQWYNGLGLNHFAVDCPFGTPPPPPPTTGADIVVKVTLVDALTGKRLEGSLTMKGRG